MSAGTLIHTFKQEAQSAGIRVNGRGIREAALDLINMGITDTELRNILKMRYGTLKRMQYDTLPAVVKSLGTAYLYQREAKTEIQELDDEAIAMLS